jgi:hypothetical protein
MARSQNKLSVRRAQPAHRPLTTRKPKSQKQHTISQLSQVKGKTLEAIEFISAPEYKGISLSFRDKTFLDLKIELAFTVKADYLDQKTGKHRVLKTWQSQIPAALN